MRWVYISPHFDDVALSVGGLVWDQVQAGQPAAIWTICAGEPPAGADLSDFALQLHQRWGTGTEAVGMRRVEDEAAGRRLGAELRYWDLPDCIYRPLPGGGWLVNGEDDLWQALHPQEEGVVDRLAGWLAGQLGSEDRLVAPLSLGNHVDHRLVRAAAERAANRAGCSLLYYPDYPYAVRPEVDAGEKIAPGWQQICWSVSEAGLAAWQDAIACHISQISTFWGGLDEMRGAIEQYWRDGGGACLWQPA